MITRVGKDDFGSLLLQNFDSVKVKYNRETIQCKAVDKNNDDTHHTGVASIIVDNKTGDNMITVIPGSNHQLTPKMVRQEMEEIIKGDDVKDFNRVIVLTQLEVPMESAMEAMKVGREWKCITILNPAPSPPSSVIDNYNLFENVDILIPNETELRSLVGGEVVANTMSEEEMAKKLLLEKGIRIAVIVTLGSRGAMIVSRAEELELGDQNVKVSMVAAPIELEANKLPVQDTVGAGDSFCGSLASYLASGINLNEAAMKACGVASISVRKKGAQSSYPTSEELPDILQLKLHGDSENNPKFKSQKLTFVTGNKKKLEEVQQILSTGNTNLGFDIVNRKIDLPELQGDPIDIAIEKCKLAAGEVKGPVFIEDTSLCFNALQGLPGPYIKWFLEKVGHDGLNNMLGGFEDKSAYAQTIVAFTMGPGERIHVFDGRTDGQIVRPRGSLDFGWDPVFEPNESGGKTYAEMEKVKKNAISHRGRSFSKFQSYLVSHNN
mmetsp:Transcript_4424/g.5749  ORF Transcript_4424/g.5749 Transcript_4424/m.5749 type:complete len:494 (-) Transcript_4424:239-1720(-)